MIEPSARLARCPSPRSRTTRASPPSSRSGSAEPDEPYPGGWRSFPTDWATLPEERLLARETLDLVRRAIDELPLAQRTVITLRDVVGCAADEVSEALGVSEGNQRVLLHRARARVRARLERHLDG